MNQTINPPTFLRSSVWDILIPYMKNIYDRLSEVGGASPTGKSDSFRSCVRAKLRAYVRAKLCVRRWERSWVRWAGRTKDAVRRLFSQELSWVLRKWRNVINSSGVLRKSMIFDQHSSGLKEIVKIRSTVQGFEGNLRYLINNPRDLKDICNIWSTIQVF